LFDITYLVTNGYNEIPINKGIYIVRIPCNFTVKFLDKTPAISDFKSKNLLYDIKMLENKYSSLQDKNILYIGKADCEKGLRQRIGQYIDYGYKKGKIHRGGRAIWQIENYEKLLIDFYCCIECEHEEKNLLKNYKFLNGDYPLANWRL